MIFFNVNRVYSLRNACFNKMQTDKKVNADSHAYLKAFTFYFLALRLKGFSAVTGGEGSPSFFCFLRS